MLLRPLAALVCTLAVLFGAAEAWPAASEERALSRLARADRRPNVVVLMTDDQKAESVRVMANVRRLLGRRGATFLNSFVSFSLCCPSRATFLTGQYAHNHGVFGNKPPEGGHAKLDHSNTLAVWLHDAGYQTVHLGKFLNGYGRTNPTEIPPGWSEWQAAVPPVSQYYDYTLNQNGTLVSYGSSPRDYQTDVLARKAVRIIRRRAPAASPFFLWVAFIAVHGGGPREPDDPLDIEIGTPAPAPRHRNDFASEPLPRPPSFNEQDVSDKPAAIRRQSLLTPERVRAVREAYQQQLESLLAVDEAVGRIVRALRATGELGNTLILFTSDNGFFHGEHRLPEGKVRPYEPSIRVPLIMRGPGIPAGLRLRQRVANIDLAPTIVEVTGARAERVMDGRSLMPLFSNPRLRLGRDLLIEWGPEAGKFGAIRTARYLYAEYANGNKELYDLVTDPHELQSRHGDDAYRIVREDLAQKLGRLLACRGASCRTR